MTSAHTQQTLPLIINWRTEITLTQKIVLAILFACVTGIMAQIKIPLPFTPVPVTGQTFAVLMAGVLLGKKWGSLSQVIYAVLGLAGIPWFSGMTGGAAFLSGPTVGYVVGFILAAFFVGHISEKYRQSQSFPFMLFIMFVAHTLIFLPGLLHLALWTFAVQGKQPTLMHILSMGLFPFVTGEIIKTTLAALTASRIMALTGNNR
ncbi:MAG: biotin transporter BioY [Deltaproteobacteria bacterium]|nr:biotin transporter BioY [Deltaproteobacteria bacterium]